MSTYKYITEGRDLMEVLCWIDKQEYIALDIETSGLSFHKDKVSLLQLGNTQQAYVLDALALGEKIKFVFPALKKKILVGHNLYFDLSMLMAGYGFFSERVICTMVQSQIHAAGEFKSHKLSMVASRWLNIEVDKTNQNSDWMIRPLSQEQIQYAVDDVTILLPLKDKLEQVLRRDGLTRTQEIEMRFLPFLVWMATTGVPLDKGMWRQTLASVNEERAALESQMSDIFPNPQLGLFGGADWPWSAKIKTNKKTGAEPIEKAVLRRLGFEFRINKKGTETINDDDLAAWDHPLAKPLRKWHTCKHNLSTYGEQWLDKLVNDRVHCEWWQMSDTGRTRCIAKGTLIEIVRDVSKQPDGIPIEEVKVGDLAYSYSSEGDLVLRQVTWAGATGHRKTVRVHWIGDGRQSTGYVDLTEDHPVLLTNGEWKAAGKLSYGDRVFSLSRTISKAGYAQIYATGYDRMQEQRFIYQQVHQEIPEHVHHDDLNKLNNQVKNLIGMNHSEHSRLHATMFTSERNNKISSTLRKLYAEGKISKNYKLGPESNNWLQLDSAQVEESLKVNSWSVTKSSRHLGVDFNTYKKHLRYMGYDLDELKRKNRLGRSDQIYQSAAHARRERADKLTGIDNVDDLIAATRTTTNNHMITKVETLGIPVDVYDLSIEETTAFIAGGICVHNSSQPNLQNLPRDKRFRLPFRTPNEELVWLKFDYAGIEMRVAAFVANEQLLIQGWNENPTMDVHMLTATRTLNREASNITKEERSIAKSQNFLSVYGGGAERLRRYLLTSAGLDIGMAVAKDLVQRYRNTYKGFAAWHRKNGQDQSTGVRTLTGRLRKLPRSDMMTTKCNTVGQGSAADGMKIACGNMYAEREKLKGAAPMLYVHDEVDWLAPKEVAYEVKNFVHKHMVDAMQPIIPTVPVVVDSSVQTSWYSEE